MINHTVTVIKTVSQRRHLCRKKITIKPESCRDDSFNKLWYDKYTTLTAFI